MTANTDLIFRSYLREHAWYGIRQRDDASESKSKSKDKSKKKMFLVGQCKQDNIDSFEMNASRRQEHAHYQDTVKYV